MRRTFLTITALGVLLTLNSCDDNRSRVVQSEQDNRELEGTATTDSSGFTNNLDRPSNTDTANTMGSGSVNAATGNYGADSRVSESAMNAQRTSTTGDAMGFMQEAAAGNLTEITTSQLALKISTNAEIKRFAEMMIKHHQTSNGELKALAVDNNVQLPTQPKPEQKTEYDKLTTMTGSAFDRAYVDLQVRSHKQTVAKFEDAAAALGDLGVQAYATKTLPVVQAHLDRIVQMQGKMGSNPQ
ncbi:MAG: DUF4142 domain-containing protein [Cytophagaceae bacterium]|nr:DUF4142 domain-containing protein [Cytophagaceae bacterium]